MLLLNILSGAEPGYLVKGSNLLFSFSRDYGFLGIRESMAINLSVGASGSKIDILDLLWL